MTQKWQHGAPPHEGWWPCSPEGYRYWNGFWWSYAARDEHSETEASYLANLESPFQEMIKWRRWEFELPKCA